jgi:hypothetical protein
MEWSRAAISLPRGDFQKRPLSSGSMEKGKDRSGLEDFPKTHFLPNGKRSPLFRELCLNPFFYS